MPGWRVSEAAALLDDAQAVAELDGMGDAYRLVFNTGTAAGQSVWHAHGHVHGHGHGARGTGHGARTERDRNGLA